MAEYKIAIMNRIARIEAGVELICNNPTDSIRFEFDEEWSGIAAKTARFSWEGNKIDVPFSGNVVKVPEIFQTKYVYIGVFTDDLTTTPVKVNCRYSIKCLGGKVVVPSEDVYNKIIALINAGVNANDGVGISSANVDASGHLIITLTNGNNIDCGLVKGADGKDGAGAEEYAAVLEDISIIKNFTPQPVEKTDNIVQLEMYQDAPLNCLTHIEPVQAGSGDPYPAGGGKNKASRVYNLDNTSVYGSALLVDAELKPNTEYVLSFMGTTGNQYYTNEQLFTRAIYPVITEERQYVYVTTRDAIDKNNYEHYEAGRGWIILKNAKDNAANNFYDVQIEEGTTPTEYTPSSNIRPIIGHTGAKLTRCGKNLLNLLGANSSENPDITTGKEANSVTYSGVVNTAWAANRYVIYLPDGRYTLSAAMESDGGIPLLAVYIGETTNGTFALVNQLNQSGSISFDVSGKNYIEIRPHFTRGTGTNGEKWTIRYYNIQIELGTAPSPFEPYQGETFSASFGQTVYSGTLDWNKGVLTVDRLVKIASDASDIASWYENVDGTAAICILATDAVVLGSDKVSDVLCSHAATVSANEQYLTNNTVVSSSGGNVAITVKGMSTAADMGAFLAAQYAAGTPVQVCYKLATPTTIQLIPQEVLALHGANNVWSDAGETTVSTRKDIIWLTHALLERIRTLEKAIVSLEGKV